MDPFDPLDPVWQLTRNLQQTGFLGGATQGNRRSNSSAKNTTSQEARKQAQEEKEQKAFLEFVSKYFELIGKSQKTIGQAGWEAARLRHSFEVRRVEREFRSRFGRMAGTGYPQAVGQHISAFLAVLDSGGSAQVIRQFEQASKHLERTAQRSR